VDSHEQLGRDVTVQIRTIPLATADESEFNRWNQETLTRENKMRERSQATGCL
jgi:hypothetical protein